ncbi:MAG: PTS sugar transporter subunit IIA [Myxococcales bacterium]|nr:PTS sugar transporter subunit IIA [Myxococcales bacterium]
MVGLVIASHGRLAEELVSTAAQIVGPLPKVATCSVVPGSSADDVKQQIRDAVKLVDDGDGVIVLADLIGGSPCTQSLTLCQQARLEVITGVNLPMLIKANALRTGPQRLALTDLAHELTAYGRRNITCATDVLRAKSPAA